MSSVVQRSGDSSFPSTLAKRDQDAARLNYLRTLFQHADRVSSQRRQVWRRNYLLLNSQLGGAPVQAWTPQPRDSEIFPVCSSLVGWMTDQEPEIEYFPAADPSSDSFLQLIDIASDITTVVKSCYASEHYDREFKKVIWNAISYGTGISKTIWDNGACKGQGNAVIRQIDPFEFWVDPYATSTADAEYFIERHFMSYAQIERMYPTTASLLHMSGGAEKVIEKPQLFATAGSSPLYPMTGNLPSGNQMPGGARGKKQFDPNPGYLVYEYWLRENDSPSATDPDAPFGLEANRRSRWRCVVMCNAEILFDELAEDLWDHAGHPYNEFRFDDIGEFYGISLIDHLASPQFYINRLLTALQQNSELVGNPVFLEPSNSGTQRTNMVNRPGQRMSVNASQASSNLPRWLQPPSMPSQVMDVLNFWVDRIENIAGLSGLQKGQAPNQRNAQGVINNVQEAAMVRIRSAMSNFSWMIEGAGSKVASLIAENYTEPRVMAIVGPSGQLTSKYLSARHFYSPDNPDDVLQFLIQVEAGANRPTSRTARSALMEKLFAMGVIDDLALLESEGIPRPQEILARLYAKQALGFGGAPGARQKAGRSS